MSTNYHDPAPEGYISINEFARILPNSSDDTSLKHKRKLVYKIIKKKDCPTYIKRGIRTFFELKSVQEYLARKFN